MKLLYKKLVKYLYKLYLTKGTKKRLHDYIRKEPAIIKNSISPSLIKEYSRLWQPLGVKPKHEWLYYYVYYNGSESKYYVPDDIYLLIIEPSMNRLAFYKGYNDKNIYDKYFAGFNMPVTLLRNMNGIYYDKEYNIIKRSDAEKLINKSHGEYFVKPSQYGGGGRNIALIKINDGVIYDNDGKISIEEIFRKWPSDFLIQERVKQHEHLSKIYPHALNTIRVFSVNLDGNVKILSSVIKIGSGGSYLDHQKYGAINVGIKNGRLADFGFNKFEQRKHEKHPYTGFNFKNMEFPFYQDLTEFVKLLHNKLYYYKCASWDIGIDERGNPVLIEVNLSGQGITALQVCNGPLFGDSFDDIINYVKDNKRERVYYNYNE